MKILNSRLPTFALRLLGALGSAALTFLIANLTNPEYLGEFQYALTIALGLSIISRVGLDRAIVRYVAAASSYGTKLSILKSALSLTFRNIFFVLLFLALTLSLFFYNSGLGEYRLLLVVVVLIFPLLSITTVFSGFFKGIFK